MAAAFLALQASPARAQVQVSAGQDVTFKFGALAQFQADTVTNPETDDRTTNLFIRRIRLIVGGQIAKNITFFIETDAPNLGKTVSGEKNISPSVIVQDAYAEFKLRDELMIDAGLMYVPFSRNYLQAGGTLLAIDYGAFTFVSSAPTDATNGRDTGFEARGYLLDNRLEYRAGMFQGVRDDRSTNPLRYAGRVQYNFFDTETAFFYTGTSLGTKRSLAVGAAFDTQEHYHAYAVDTFVDMPVGPGAFTGQFDYTHLDGEDTITSLPKQDNILIEAGYLVRSIHLTPFLQFANQDVVAAGTADDQRWSIGASYWWHRHNVNIKGAYGTLRRVGSERQHQFTVQLQLFYY
jgi:hypothetical protein